MKHDFVQESIAKTERESEMRSRSVRFVLMGFYGRGNFGDDLMCLALTRFLLQEGASNVAVVTCDPDAHRNLLSPNVSIVVRKFGNIVSALRRADVFCQGGGTIFHDSYKGRHLLRYWRNLLMWTCVLWLARIIGLRVIMVGAGIGPLNHAVSRGLARLAFAACDVIGLRDAASQETLRDLRVDVPHYLGFDLAALGGTETRRTAQTSGSEPRILGISACCLTPFLGDPELNQRYWWALGDALARFATAHSVRIVFFSLFAGLSSEADDTVADLIASRLPQHLPMERHSYDGQVEQFSARVAACDWFVSTKFHAAVAAYLSECELAVVSYNRKLSDFADEIHLAPERRVAADRVQSVETWVSLLESFPSSVTSSQLLSRKEAVHRAITCLQAVLQPEFR